MPTGKAGLPDVVTRIRLGRGPDGTYQGVRRTVVAGPAAVGRSRVVGILLAGANHSTVVGNTVTGNHPTGPSFASGGIAVTSTAPLGGTDPIGNLIKANKVHNNQPDLFYDGTGSDNVFVANSCETSIPAGLC
jgi:hypothetical protein